MPQNPPVTREPQSNDDIDLGRLFGVLIDHKWLIAFITALFALAGVMYALLATPIYRADALVQIEDAAPSMNPLSEVTTMLGQEPPSQSEIGIIRSRMVLGRAVDILNLDLLVEPNRVPVVGEFLERIGIARPAFAANWGFTWAGDAITVDAMPVAEEYLDETFTLTVLGDTRYAISHDGEPIGEGRVGQRAEFLDGGLALTVASIDALPGAEFDLTHIRRLTAIGDLKDRLSISEQGQETGLLDLGLTGPVPALAETTLASITDIYVAQNIQRQSQEARNSLEFLRKQVPQVRADLNQAEAKLNAYRTDRESVDLSLETQSVLERLVNLEAQLNELSFTESEISRRFEPTHPTYAALLEKKGQLQKEKANLERKINSLPETQQEILRLQRDVAVTQEIYVQLRNKVQEMQIAEASTVGNVRVLDTAEVFPEPVKPNKKLIVVVATLLGAMIGVGLVLLRAAFNRGVETTDQLEALGLPVYATVPLSEEQEKLNRRVRRGSNKGKAIPVGLLAERNPADTSVEALRGLRTSLHFAMLEGADNRLMITGPSPNIGKSFISANLAAVCAQAGQRVLVVDGDMRKGHIHRVFGARSEGGLSDILSGRKPLDEVIRPVNDSLHYVARGMAPPNPSELLTSQRFSEFLHAVGERYDLVIIDSPPVLAVTDAAIIGKQVGTTLMVARFQLNPAKEIELAMRRLETANVQVKGAILNALERKAATAYGYGYYNYSYK
ncbi:polysaccharide biosynthesis tyrosine autokinase [Modicisalibacter xianhensis]|uniref:Tyrosine-protein kinase Etk/Wzc n=1 Tax=Modicisalibacter xianhensis TaxID=442341 RepID=A0A1I2ZC22_9GAMM|nr:polysaccharide biosynthesis tyrosine autokinase [Halomonas xianhensis]SFH35387.1 tyrosine-protein kinase Etk/Wzc [Halomonas xianhensis]